MKPIIHTCDSSQLHIHPNDVVENKVVHLETQKSDCIPSYRKGTLTSNKGVMIATGSRQGGNNEFTINLNRIFNQSAGVKAEGGYLTDTFIVQGQEQAEPREAAHALYDSPEGTKTIELKGNEGDDTLIVDDPQYLQLAQITFDGGEGSDRAILKGIEWYVHSKDEKGTVYVQRNSDLTFHVVRVLSNVEKVEFPDMQGAVKEYPGPWFYKRTLKF